MIPGRHRAALVAAALLSAAQPALSEENALVPEKGDVYCVGYEAENHSCNTKITVRDIRGEYFHYGSEATMSDLPPNLATVMIAQDRFVDDRFCGVLGSCDIAFEPSDHPLSFLTRIGAIGFADEMARNNVCYFIRQCGDQYSTVTFKGEDRFPAVDSQFSYFPADDPDTATLTVRAAPSTEINNYRGTFAQECLPSG